MSERSQVLGGKETDLLMWTVEESMNRCLFQELTDFIHVE